MKNYEDELTSWWDTLADVPEPVRALMLRQWDSMGRSQRNVIESIIELLDLSDGYEDFVQMYKQFMRGSGKLEILVSEEATQWYRVFMHGKLVGTREFSAELSEKVFKK